jgi:hypothetical protein
MLRDRFRRNTISNLLLASELRSLLDRFEAAGIKAIPFKGPTLAAYAYGDLALRQFHDLDLLLRRDDVLAAKNLLVESGYRAEHRFSQAQEAALLRSECEYTFKGSVYVELQWEIVPANFAFTINDAALWQRVREIEVEGLCLPMLAPEDLLLILCAHGTKHNWTRLAWIADVAEVLRHGGEINWPALLERARKLGGTRMLCLGTGLAHHLLGASLPVTLARKIANDHKIRQLITEVSGRLFIEGRNDGALRQSLFYIRSRERLRDRARCYLHMALSPNIKDITSTNLVRPFRWLYYPLRPLRLGTKYGQRLLKRLTG